MLVYSNRLGRPRLDALFQEVAEIYHFRHPHVMPYQNNRTLFLCRGLRGPMDRFWRSIKNFHSSQTVVRHLDVPLREPDVGHA